MIEDFYYMINDGTLYLSSDPDGKFAVSTHTDQYGGLCWPWNGNHDIAKVVVEDRVMPTICANMFKGCESLTEVEGLTNLDTSHVTNMNGMFHACLSLTSLDLSHLDTDSVTDMGGMFAYCDSLKSLDLSTFDTSNVINMRDMFDYCRSLTSIEGLGNLDTSHVTDMSYMFGDCISLETLDLGGWDTSKVTDMSDMFACCGSLTSLDLSGWDTSQVTNGCCIFDCCRSLVTVTTNDEGIISEIPARTKVIEPTVRAGRETTPSLEATISQFSATADALQAAVTALQGNIADMREAFGSDPR